MSLKPTDLYSFMHKSVVGQDDALRYVSVAIFKHLCGDAVGNLLMIGNSGTGKTTVMRAVEQLYLANPSFQKHRVVARLNANTLANEEGTVLTGRQLFQTLQDRAVQILGEQATPDNVKLLIEHATVCIDEVDKVSTIVGGKSNPTGINVQQSLLTLMEDEKVTFDTQLVVDGKYRPVQMEIDTKKLLFICGGAFEELYDQVYARVYEEKGQEELTEMVSAFDGGVEFEQVFSLSEYLRQEDLFKFGMLPQFLSRFDTTLVLAELTPEVLEVIFTGTKDSLFESSKRFFQRFKIALQMTDEAKRLIAQQAARQARVGARALKEVYGRIIKPFEFEPFQQSHVVKNDENEGYTLTLTKELVESSLS